MRDELYAEDVDSSAAAGGVYLFARCVRRKLTSAISRYSNPCSGKEFIYMTLTLDHVITTVLAAPSLIAIVVIAIAQNYAEMRGKSNL